MKSKPTITWCSLLKNGPGQQGRNGSDRKGARVSERIYGIFKALLDFFEITKLACLNILDSQNDYLSRGFNGHELPK